MTTSLPFVRNLSASLLAATVATAASASTTTADYMGTTSTAGLGSFTAQVTYTHNGGSHAILSLFITNTTAPSVGGYITAIALSPVGVTGMELDSCTNSNFHDLGDRVAAQPYGTFMGGAGTGNSWTGGGSANKGIAAGSSATFVFDIEGSASVLAARDAESILTSDSGDTFAVRFRGMAHGGSDKVLGTFVSNTVPGPASLAALGMMLLPRGRRRK
ncbi:MAG: hypothetical protein U0636_08975 [Phycisphaerales bacterium]